MILVICGAGASYDSVTSLPLHEFGRAPSPYRPPLASELFNPDNVLVKDAIKEFPQCYEILPYLQRIPDGQSIETKLEELQNEAEVDLVRKKHIAAILYYLQYLISQFERRWADVHSGVTNYRTLIDQLRRAEEPVCFVTFNYDCMIEMALWGSRGIKTDSLSDYTADEKFKLFKLHGSVNWFKTVIAPFAKVDRNRNEMDIVKELINSVAAIKTGEFRIRNLCPIGKLEDTPVWPAIAIPVTTKRMFECPDEHLAMLKQLLPQTKKIVTIGWRGAEYNFLEILSKSLEHRQLPILPIAGSEEGRLELVDNFRRAGILLGVFPSESGFSDAIVARSIERFCK